MQAYQIWTLKMRHHVMAVVFQVELELVEERLWLRTVSDMLVLLFSHWSALSLSLNLNQQHLRFCLFLKNFKLWRKETKPNLFLLHFTFVLQSINYSCVLRSHPRPRHALLVAFVWFVSWYLCAHSGAAVHIMMFHLCWWTQKQKGNGLLHLKSQMMTLFLLTVFAVSNLMV